LAGWLLSPAIFGVQSYAQDENNLSFSFGWRPRGAGFQRKVAPKVMKRPADFTRHYGQQGF
jgi:hypothetical protein